MAISNGRAVNGTARMEYLFGSTGDDLINPKGGNDWVFGGKGTDIVVLDGSFADYFWSAEPPSIFNFFGLFGPSITVRGPDGVDRLFGVEALQFDDRIVRLDGGNDAPIAMDDFYTVRAGETLVVSAAEGLLANDREPNGDYFYLWRVTDLEAHADVFPNLDGGFSYVPRAGFVGIDTFTYEITDANGATDSATVTVSVTPSMIGKTLRITREVPQGNEIAGGDVVIGDGIDTHVDNYFSVDVQANRIVITATGAGMPSGAFNGIHIEDTINNLADIASVAVDAETDAAGFDQSKISYDDDNIWINLSQLYFGSTSQIVLGIEFA